MNLIREAAEFVKKSCLSFRRGDFTREPLTILRLEWRKGNVECDWLMRALDPWDSGLPEQRILERQTLQAFRDALDLRALIFDSFSAAMEAQLRMYRADRDHRLELLMIGRTSRLNQCSDRVPSLAMRAKLSGFQFVLTNGVFEGPLAV